MSTLLVNDQLIRRLLEDPVGKDLPCLQNLPKDVRIARQNCRRCPKKNRQIQTSPALDRARRCLFELAEPQMQQLKEILKVRRLVFYFNEQGVPPRAVR